MSPEAARDEILAVFNTAWSPLGHTVKWTDIPGDAPNGDEPWARVTLRHESGKQIGFGSHSRLHQQSGTLFVQVFAPIGDGSTKALQLARTVLMAYINARGSVWYRNHRLKETGNSGAFEQINVLVDFSYDVS